MSAPTARNAPLWATVLATVLGLILIGVAVVYFADTAAKLPSFFPGHSAGSQHHHTKHGIAALILGVLALIAAWMSAGKRRRA